MDLGGQSLQCTTKYYQSVCKDKPHGLLFRDSCFLMKVLKAA